MDIECQRFWNNELFFCPLCSIDPILNPQVAIEHMEKEHQKTIPPLYPILCQLMMNIEKDSPEYRQSLEREALAQVIHRLENEIRENKENACCFCRRLLPRRQLFEHMLDEHGFQIGQPDNLVYVDDFLELLRQKLSNCTCIFCERQFPDSSLLRKHMRKKKHFRVNPRNHNYDKFYLVNYYKAQEESDEEEGEGDWAQDQPTMCLFDQEMFPNPEEALEHLKKDHNCHLDRLDFFDRTRLVNYIRQHLAMGTCHLCKKEWTPAHHHEDWIPDKEEAFWKDVQYLFPYFENDPLLMLDVEE